MADDDNEDEFPSNSKQTRVPISDSRPRKRIEKGDSDPTLTSKKKKLKVVRKGKMIVRKKTFTESFSETFLGEDAQNVVAYIFYDVLIPAAKNTLQEIVSGGIEMLLFGERNSRSRGLRSSTGSKVSYSNFYQDMSRGRHNGNDNRSSRRRSKMDNIILEDRGEAEDILDALIAMIDEYGQVSVADLYETAGMDGGDFTDNKWGWTNLSRAKVNRVRDGYQLELPPEKELD